MRRVRYIAAALVLAITTPLPFVGAARATFPGADGRIAFGSSFPARIITIDPTGSGRKAVTPLTRSSLAPAWSADGSKIAFVRERRYPGYSHYSLVTSNADGSNPLTVVPFSRQVITSPAWSPDGSTIAYCSSWIDSAVFTVDANGTSRTKLTTGAHEDCDPAWSPDGALIALDTRLRRRHRSRIVTIHPDGTSRRVVVLSGFNYSPDWSPDGSHLTFTRWVRIPGRSYGFYDIFTVRADDGTELTNITHTPERGEWAPAYSPTGTRLVYARDQRGSVLEDLWIKSADGTGHPRRLTDTPHRSETEPDWQAI